MDNRTMIEKMRGKEIPEYRDTMYLEGYSPYEILEAARKTIIQEHETRAEEEAEAAPLNVHIQSEVKTK